MVRRTGRAQQARDERVAPLTGAVFLEVQEVMGLGPVVSSGRLPSRGAGETTCLERIYSNQYLTAWWCEQRPCECCECCECREYGREASLHFAVSSLSFGL